MMRKFLKKTGKGLALFTNAFRYSAQFLYRGISKKKSKEHIKYMVKLFVEQLHRYTYYLARALNEYENDSQQQKGIGTFDGPMLKKMHRIARGLHQLLPFDQTYTYSILLPVSSSSVDTFKRALESALQQTAPYMEVIVGFRGQPSNEIYQQFRSFQKAHPECLKSIQIAENLSQARLVNEMAEQATGHFLVFMEQQGWIRPDLLFRYEQTLRLLSSSEKTFLYCDEYTLKSNGELALGDQFSRPDDFYFPYVFSTFIPGCFLLSKGLWNRAEGVRESFDGAHFYDLLLRLNLMGAITHKIQIKLYARSEATLATGSKAEKSAIRAFQEYTQSKNLTWSISPGCLPGTLRAIPALNKVPHIHVIIPFKDQKELTLAAVKSLGGQQGVNLKVTAVDNRSEDLSIGYELEAQGVEVLKVDEPFNFSRLNNLAVQRTGIGKECELVFFMNNDVELEPDALLEMSRWVDQPGIGMVGCRLNYPNGLLQCGGVDLDRSGPAYQITWSLLDNSMPFDLLRLQRTLRVVASVSGAATLMKKEVYIQAGGFDEIWYPISFSDTNLSLKVKTMGLWNFYTPFAVGIHHESVSRVIEHKIEDYEASYWLQEHYFTHKTFTALQVD